MQDKLGRTVPEQSTPIPLGSEAHKVLFCKALLDTFDPFKPAIADWPALSEADRQRLVSLPIWNMAVQTEGKASTNVASYAKGISDPLLREAIALNAFEENRHKKVLSNLASAYDIPLEKEPPYAAPRDSEWAFMVTGYSECVDSFFAFGLFEAAKRSGYFPPTVVEAFEPIMREEGRHILFFVNWVAWQRRNMSLWQRIPFEARILGVWVFLLWERLQTLRDVGGGESFTMRSQDSLNIDLDVRDLVATCLAENERRLAPYDARLIRPAFVPLMARLAHRVLVFFTKLQPARPAASGPA